MGAKDWITFLRLLWTDSAVPRLRFPVPTIIIFHRKYISPHSCYGQWALEVRCHSFRRGYQCPTSPRWITLCNPYLGIKSGIKDFGEIFCGSWTGSALVHLQFPVILHLSICASPLFVGVGNSGQYSAVSHSALPRLHFLHLSAILRFRSPVLHRSTRFCTGPTGKVQIGTKFCG